MRTTIAVLNKKGDPALPAIIEVLKNIQNDQDVTFTVAGPEKIGVHKNLNLLNMMDIRSPVAIGCSFTDETSNVYRFQHLDDDVVTVFEGTTYTSSAIKENYEQGLTKKLPHTEAQLQEYSKRIEGDYLIFILKNEELIVIRDPIGAQPLYYGENEEQVVFASNRKTLWQLGIVRVSSFPPGNLCLLTKSGLQFKPVKTFTQVETMQISMDDAAWKLQKFLEQSIETRVTGVKEVTVAFSGGLDSSLIAYMSSKCGVKVDLIHVSLENESETDAAFEASEKLGLPIHIHLFKESDVEETLPKIVDLIEDANPIKVAIGVPVYWVAQKTRAAGRTVLLAGQGADELFGGYHRYVHEYCNIFGDKNVQQIMFDDVINIHENNLERDKKICMNLDVELRLPFISYNLVEFALGLPVNLKFEPKQDSLRKLVLRRVALNMGLPVSIVNKPKKAVQYSTGINNAIKRIAQKNGQTVNDYIMGLFEEKLNSYRK